MFLMNNKLSLLIVTAVLGFGVGLALAKPVCNTTTSSKCTSGGESCTKTVKKCTTFNPDGTTTIETTTSHDCGPGGPKDCAGSGSGSGGKPLGHSRFGVVSNTIVQVKDASSRRKPKVPLTDVSQTDVRQKATPTSTPKRPVKHATPTQQLQQKQ